MKRSIIYFVIIAGMLACSNPQKKITDKVNKLETEVREKFSAEKAKELINTYNQYIEKYPTDSTSRLFMAKGTEMSILNNDPESALHFINLFLKQFPNDTKAGLMQFKKAMVYDLLINDQLRAIAEYETFIKKYPDDPMRKEAENAIILLQNPEDFMKSLQSAADTSASK